MTLIMLVLILFTVTLSACGQLALKLAMGNPAMVTAIEKGGAGILFVALTSPMLWLGIAIYGFSVLLWLWVLAKVDLSVAYPFVGLSFLITMAFGVMLLNESVTPLRMLGTILIALGCILVGKSA